MTGKKAISINLRERRKAALLERRSGIFHSLLNSFHNLLNSSTRRKSAMFAVLLLVAQVLSAPLALAQTRESDPGQQSGSEQGPEGRARQTEGTVRNPYYNSRGQLDEIERARRINQNYVSGQENQPRGVDGPFGAVDKIITGEYTNLVFQAAEQRQGGDVQKIARNSLNASLGSINETYRGMHQWFKDDLVGNLFSHIGQLIGKWLSELINGWIADTVQYLAQFLRIFVLNPNVAVNGLNGKQNDGISPYIRQGADVMYGIAVDLLLLLFILCIWKFWADAAWKGAGNLMAPVGRLIFTAGLLLAWPTIYAFEIQITNEMIKAIYFNSNDQLAMLHFALATTVKGGLIAAGAGALTVFAPILGNFALGAAAPMVGSLFYFASLVIFTILGGILIAELVYILVLKAIQTALLVAQYMFAPIFLVFFATPDTEQIASGFVKAFVETSLWTFIWVGLLKVMVIIIYSNFNPWGKILIAIGVLQLMIQVPSFLARAQISPMSDFISAGLVTGGLFKAFSGLSGVIGGGLNTLIGKSIESKMLQGQLTGTDSLQTGLGGPAGNGQLLNGLNRVSETERNRHGGPGTGPAGLPGTTAAGTPPLRTPGSGTGVPAVNPAAFTGTGGTGTPTGTAGASGTGTSPLTPSTTPLATPPAKPTGLVDPLTGMPLNPATAGPAALAAAGGPGRPSPFVSPALAAAAAAAGVSLAGGSARTATAGTGGTATVTGTGTAAGGGADQFRWESSSAEGWDEKNLINVPVRKLIGKLTSVDGVGIRTGQQNTSILGTADHGVQRVNIANGADGAEVSRAMYTAAFTDQVAHDDQAKDAARRSAFAAGAHQPKGFKQAMIANWLEANGKSWYSTPWAKENFNKGIFAAAADGSKAFITGGQGNAYTDYLKGRFGDWDADGKGTQDAMAVHLITNPESSESPWNRNIGPATENLIQSGIPISASTRGAMQNMAIQAMHPARRKQAVFATLSYLYPQAKEMYGNEDPAVFGLALGEMARALPADQVNSALTMYQISGQSDLNPGYASAVSALAVDTGRDLPMAYGALATAAPYVAQQIGRVRAGTNLASIRTIADLDAVVQPAHGETHQQAFQVVMESTSAALKAGELHGVPMKTVMNPDVAPSLYEFMGADMGNMNTPQAHRKMQIVARNLGTIGTPNDTRTLNAIYTYVNNGGSLNAMDADHVNVTARLVEAGVTGRVLPSAVDVAIQGGYANSTGPLPIAEIQAAASHYASGQVSDYRFVPVVSHMARAGMSNISNQTIRIAAEAIADTGGNFHEEHVKAVIRVSQGLRNSNLAPNVVETFVRAEGHNQGIANAADLPLHQLIGELESRGTTMDTVASHISTIQRAGGFSDHQLQDSSAVQLMVDTQTSGSATPHTMQAVNVVTRVVGADAASSRPQFIEVTEEYLANNGKMRDLDIRPIHALADLDSQRQVVQAQINSMTVGDPARLDLEQKMARFRLNFQTMQKVTRDPNYQTGNGVSGSVWDSVFQ